ncbi:MAG: 50S ribosomal protein L17 [Clostridia bacterium]|jgi:large subunit ribosomal protein L17|nr:50S ribosomal protein L17 [Clostridia bacterium]
MPGTRKLGRPTAHRQAMLKGMVTYLLENGSIETTLTRAKEVRSLTEKMITLGKKNTLAAKRAAMSFITKEDVVKKLFDTIAPEYADRNGGYTRMYKLGPRRGDGAEMALIKLVADEKAAKEETKKESKKAAKAETAKVEEKAEEAKVEEVVAETTEEPKAE